MKTETIQIIAEGEIAKALEGELKKHRSETDAASALGVSQPEYSRARRGVSNPARKLAEKLSIEKRTVYVLKNN